MGVCNFCGEYAGVTSVTLTSAGGTAFGGEISEYSYTGTWTTDQFSASPATGTGTTITSPSITTAAVPNMLGIGFFVQTNVTQIVTSSGGLHVSSSYRRERPDFEPFGQDDVIDWNLYLCWWRLGIGELAGMVYHDKVGTK